MTLSDDIPRRAFLVAVAVSPLAGCVSDEGSDTGSGDDERTETGPGAGDEADAETEPGADDENGTEAESTGDDEAGTETEPTGDDETGTEAESDAGDDVQEVRESIDDTGPEGAVLDFLQAIDDGDVAAANEAVHDESPLAVDTIDEPGVTIHELERRDLREVIREQTDASGEELDRAVEARERELADLSEEVGFDAYAYVYNSITSAQHGDEEAYVLVVEVDGKWLILDGE